MIGERFLLAEIGLALMFAVGKVIFFFVTRYFRGYRQGRIPKCVSRRSAKQKSMAINEGFSSVFVQMPKKKQKRKSKKGRNKDGTFKKGHKNSRTKRNRKEPKRKKKSSKKKKKKLDASSTINISKSRRNKGNNKGGKGSAVEQLLQAAEDITGQPIKKIYDLSTTLVDAAAEVAGPARPTEQETTESETGSRGLDSFINRLRSTLGTDKIRTEL